MIGPIDLVPPSPAPHFITFKVFLVCYPKCPICSTLQSCDFKRNISLDSSLSLNPVNIIRMIKSRMMR